MNYKQISAHIALRNTRGHVLLVKRRDVPLWVMPGGRSEKNETPITTVLRELYEETGISLHPHYVHLAVTYAPENAKGRRRYLFLSTGCKKKPHRTREAADAGFFPTDSLPRAMLQYEKQRVNDALSYQFGKQATTSLEIAYGKEALYLVGQPVLLCKLLFHLMKLKMKER